MFRRDLTATPEERDQELPGDHFVADPAVVIDNAVTIAAAPERVWPWLAQMGSGRAGWYAYDFVDNDGVPSASSVIPALQQIATGDVMPALPGAADLFVVKSVRPGEDLVLAIPGPGDEVGVSWEFFLQPSGASTTRLLVRGRVGRDWPGGLQASPTPGPKRPIEYVYKVLAKIPHGVMMPIALCGHGVMQARQLRGIKRRAEAAMGEDAVQVASGRSAPPWSPWRGTSRRLDREPPPHATAIVTGIKAVHTLAWFSIESCMVYVLAGGFIGRSDRRVGIAAGVVTAESLIFAGNGFRCPLTQLAERYGADRGGVTDIYLPA